MNQVPKLIQAKTIRDTRGAIGVVETGSEIDFVPKRIYYLFDLHARSERGAHAHRRLFQAMFALSGSCEIRLTDGDNEWAFRLDSPDIGLSVPPGYWRSLGSFAGGTVLLVLASDAYDEHDYIRNWEDFVAWRAQQYRSIL